MVKVIALGYGQLSGSGLIVATAHRPLALSMSSIYYVLNAYSG